MINNWTSTAGASNMVSLAWVGATVLVIFEPSTKRIIAVLMSDRIIKIEGNKCV